MIKIRPVLKSERNQMLDLFNSITLFKRDEVDVIVELLDIYLDKLGKENVVNDYLFFVTENFSSFICFGPTPMTIGTYDLYWLGTNPHFEKQGLAKALVNFMVNFLKERGSHLIRVETSSQDSYGGTVAFYNRLKFFEEARIKDFYKVGDDLIIYTYRV